MDKTIQKKITECVESYKKVFPVEYGMFVEQQKERKKNLINKWSEVDKGLGMIQRELNRYPETLYSIFKRSLTDDEYLQFTENDAQIWFGNTFKEFNMSSTGKL